MSKPIELTNVVRPLKVKTLFFFLKIAVCIASAFLIVQASEIVWTKTKVFYGKVITAVTRTEIIREYVSTRDVPVEELITKFARQYKLHEVILQALILKESLGGKDDWSYAFEQKTFDKRASLDSKYTENERRMRSSSHGITQVMGFRSEQDCGVHWSKLYDKAIAIECASKIMRANLDAVKGKTNAAKRLREAFRMYNGSGEAAELYADAVMSRVGELLFNQLKE